MQAGPFAASPSSRPAGTDARASFTSLARGGGRQLQARLSEDLGRKTPACGCLSQIANIGKGNQGGDRKHGTPSPQRA